MFRIYRRWGAAPRMELDPGFRISSSGRWVGEVRGLAESSVRCGLTLDMSSAAGLIVGQGLIEAPDMGPSISCTLEGDENFGMVSLLLWLQSTDWRAPLLVDGSFDVPKRDLSATWRTKDGASGPLSLRRI